MIKLNENWELLPVSANQYAKFNPKMVAKLKVFSHKLHRKTILHINAAPKGGGVAEILRSQIGFEQNLGLNSHWYGISAPRKFFTVTKKIHNLLQGQTGLLRPSELETYLDTNRRLEASLIKVIADINPDLIIIHDPQPLPLIAAIPRQIPTILRLHIDLSVDSRTLHFLKPMIQNYQSLIISSAKYRPNFDWFAGQIMVISPAIDPLVEKNLPMPQSTAEIILRNFNINPQKPILTQVSRFDKWKDPLGVIRAFYLAQNQIPDLQLVLAGFSIAQDDPEAQALAAEVRRAARGDHSIFIFSDPCDLHDVSNDSFISALYTASDVIIQNSLKEGFGLTMTEAMWKGKVVIAGDTEGARLQIRHNYNGFIINSADTAAAAIIKVLTHPQLAKRLGSQAVASVRQKYLLPKFILSNLACYQKFLR